MKSPLPTSFALLLAALCAVAAIFLTGVVLVFGRMRALPDLDDARLGAAVINCLLLLGLLIYSIGGVVAGLRYRQKRKALNWIGLVGNSLLLLGFVGLFGYSYWKKHQTVSRSLQGPVEVVEQQEID
ncbi:hypothetical protein EJV47_22235 [Hymenobacter gummosus]|uniref:Uncharacterized protein n=1 Tax=Hymenobacter gummosus TaxID=1776032 RepID=A0A431TXJ2_9BACT|nr:hypothetical protein [Hymenobacter gummosus]RTQ46251.1 hypothetical protein EJV47_22235 [Hymenobacter gummosus]